MNEQQQEPIVQQDFSIYEQEAVQKSEEKIIWFGEKHLSIKQRVYQFIATVVSVTLKNLVTKRSWQLTFFIWITITLPIGTYHLSKWIFNLFF